MTDEPKNQPKGRKSQKGRTFTANIQLEEPVVDWLDAEAAKGYRKRCQQIRMVIETAFKAAKAENDRVELTPEGAAVVGEESKPCPK